MYLNICLWYVYVYVCTCVYMCLCTFGDLESGLSETCVKTRMRRAKSGKTLAKARFDINGQIVLYTWVSQLIPSGVSLRRTEAQQF